MSPDRKLIRFEAMLGFQLGILLLGLAVGCLTGLMAWTPIFSAVDDRPALSWLGFGPLVAVGSGAVVAVMMIVTVGLLSRFGFAWWREIDQLLGDTLVPSLRRLRLWQLALLASVAGIGEELCFRWAIHGALERGLEMVFPGLPTFEGELLEAPAGPSWADGWGRSRWLVFGTAAVLSALAFGLCHAVTRAYWVLATGVGVVFSVMAGCGSGLLGAMIAHAVYDFLAFLWLCHSKRDDELTPAVGGFSRPVDPRG